MPCTVPVGNPPEPCGNSTSEMFPNYCPLHVDLADDPWPDELPGLSDQPVAPAAAMPGSRGPSPEEMARRIAYARRVLAATPMFGSPKLTPAPTTAPTGTDHRHSPEQTARSRERDTKQSPDREGAFNVAPPTGGPESPTLEESESPGVRKSPPRCNATTRSGNLCRFSARKESGLCVNHDPSYKDKQRDNTRKGGRRSAESRYDLGAADPLPLRELNFATRADIQATIALVTRLELFGRLSPVRSRNLLRALSIAARNVNGMGSTAYHAYPGSASYLEQFLPDLLEHAKDPPPTESTHEKR